MDKPRHPLVIRPWKTQSTKPNKWKVPLLGTQQGRIQHDLNACRSGPFGSKSRKKAPK